MKLMMWRIVGGLFKLETGTVLLSSAVCVSSSLFFVRFFFKNYGDFEGLGAFVALLCGFKEHKSSIVA